MKQFWIFDFRFWIGRSSNKKILCLVLVALLFALCFSAEAQQPPKVHRVGFLRRSYPQPADFEAFHHGLVELGYVQGKNLIIEQRYANGLTDRLSELAAELVGLNVEVIVVDGTITAQAAKAATETIPIVFTIVGDPVGSALVRSLARPGGNLTGATHISSELSSKRLELLNETVPGASRVAVLRNPDNIARRQWTEFEATARALGVQLRLFDVRHPRELKSTLFKVANGNTEAVIAWPDAILDSNRKEVVDLAGKKRLPGIYERREFVDVGGLMSYGPILSENFRRAAYFVDRILKGAKAADLPVEQPTKFELVINLKTAKQIGVTIPPHVLARADKVIK